MTLEKHVIDTVKEWQTKIGTDDAGVRLYYPKVSMCGYLKLPVEEDSEKICQEAEAYFEKSVPELGHVTVIMQEGWIFPYFAINSMPSTSRCAG